MKKFVLAMPLGLSFIQFASLDELLAAEVEAANDWFYPSRVTQDMPR